MTLAVTVSATTPRPESTSTDDEGDVDLEHVERAKDVLGFDPRRFFDAPLLSVEQGAMNPVERMRAIIRGLDRKEKVASLMAVERQLDRGPRDEVLGMLEDRMAFLEEEGERPPDLRDASLDERPLRFTPADREVPPKKAFIVEDDGTRVPYDEKRDSSASAKLGDLRSEEGST